MPLRILAVQTGFILTAGGARADFETLGALARLGHHVRIVMPAINRNDPVPPGVSIRYIPARGLKFAQSLGLAALPWLLQEGRRFRPDIIRDHSPYTFGVCTFALGRVLGVPTVASFLHAENGTVNTWTEERLLSHYDHVITISRFSLSQLVGLDVTLAPKSSYVYCGVGPEFKPQDTYAMQWRVERQLPPDEPLFSTAGSLIPRKNHAFLLDAMERWVSEGRNGTLVILGEGPERTKLTEDIARRGLEERVLLWGYLGQKDYLALLNASTAFLFPSLMEGFGMAATEALACGVPALVSDCASLPEIVRHETTGYVLPVGSGPQPWVSAMARWSRIQPCALKWAKLRLPMCMHASIGTTPHVRSQLSLSTLRPVTEPRERPHEGVACPAGGRKTIQRCDILIVGTQKCPMDGSGLGPAPRELGQDVTLWDLDPWLLTWPAQTS